MMRELHSGGELDAELKPLKPKTGERGETVGCVCVSVRTPVRESRGLPFLWVTSRAFLKVKTTVGCGNRRGLWEIR